MRQRDMRDVGELFQDQFTGTALVVRIYEAEEEADGDRLHAELLQPPYAPPHGLFVEPHDDVALEVAAFGNGNACAAPCDRMGRWGGRVPDLLFVVSAQLDLVPVPLGGEQSGGSAAHLNHGVVGRGRAVDEGLQGPAEGLRAEAEGARQLRHRGEDPDRLVVGRRRCLVHDDLPVRRDADEVGECAPDVDADPVALLRHADPPRPPLNGGGRSEILT